MNKCLLGEASAFEHSHKNNIQKQEKSMHDAISLYNNVSMVDKHAQDCVLSTFEHDINEKFFTVYLLVKLNTL